MFFLCVVDFDGTPNIGPHVSAFVPFFVVGQRQKTKIEQKHTTNTKDGCLGVRKQYLPPFAKVP